MWIERYTCTLRKEWNAFVERSKNGTFLFLREYMDYHRERFEDSSLVFRRAPGAPLLALLPANLCGPALESHGGLTYGGVVCDAAMTTEEMMALFGALCEHLRERGIPLLRYRAIPHIYHRGPAEEDLYALLRLGARLVRRVPLSVIDRRHPTAPQDRRRRGRRKAAAAGLRCRESDELAAYWELLTHVLRDTYGACPVHSLDEISALQRVLPSHIRLFGCFAANEMMAGVVIYETPTVARAQYIAASPAGKRAGALDLLLDHLLREVYSDKPFLDLGSSEGNDPCGLNAGVLEFKESLGARLVVQDTYDLAIAARAS